MSSNLSDLESLPVELITEILAELDLTTLIVVSALSSRLRRVIFDPSLNPWRKPIYKNLRERDVEYEHCFWTLPRFLELPRQNWIDIFTIARPEFLLFEMPLPVLSESDWEECFKRRFLPGWTKWQQNARWRAAFLKFAVYKYTSIYRQLSVA